VTDTRLDCLDRDIMELLGRDARISNRQIATSLRVTEGTVRTRIKRLQQRKAIHFSLVMHPAMAGSPTLVMFGIHADPGRVPELAAQLATFPIISCVVTLLGRYSVLAMGFFASLEAVDELIRTAILPLPGVRRVETSLVAHSYKYQVHMARIIARAPC
jgi:Lrp/AsnC family transcriptional regulator, regulator for asnA, asnC and gidA